MAHLLIDNSNTRTKFRLADDSGLLSSPHRVAPTSELTPALLDQLLGTIHFSHAVLCSVVPVKAEILQSWLSPRGPVHVVSSQSQLDIAIDYPNPEQIGADRLANAVAAHARYGAPAIVIDFGTAVTFDVIGSPASYLGGAIAPGLASMTDNLAKRTALLPQIELEEPASAIGKSTVHAMQIGAVLGYRGMIREILAGICQDLVGEPAIVATGGDAALIARGLPAIAHLDPDLTMEGIWRIGQGNISPDSNPPL